MKVDIIKAEFSHLPACEEALIHSELGKHYFETEGSARKA